MKQNHNSILYFTILVHLLSCNPAIFRYKDKINKVVYEKQTFSGLTYLKIEKNRDSVASIYIIPLHITVLDIYEFRVEKTVVSIKGNFPTIYYIGLTDSIPQDTVSGGWWSYKAFLPSEIIPVTFEEKSLFDKGGFLLKDEKVDYKRTTNIKFWIRTIAN